MTRDELISQYELIKNTSKKYPNGSVWKSLSCGEFTIIGKTNRCNKNGSYIYCLCEFQDGAIVEADFTNIKKGNVKSPNCPNIFGRGYMGQGKWKSSINKVQTKEYSLWMHMMCRCYSDRTHLDSPSYKNVEVCERWHCFQNFCEDIQHLDGYENWKNKTGYELDKDIICQKLEMENKIYSPDTCMFISKKDNVSESTSRKNLTGKTYIAFSPSGEMYEFYCIQDFANEHPEISRSSIDRSLKEKRSIKGWVFKVKEESKGE